MQKWMVVVVAMFGMMVCAMDRVCATDSYDKRPQPTSERNWQIGINPSYSSGNFGTTTTNEFVYVPLSIRRYFRDGDVSLVIPFVSVTSNGTATLVGGQPIQTLPGRCLKKGGTEIDTDKPECLALLNAGQGVAGQTAQKVTNSGLGDIILRGRYYLVEERDYVPLIAITGRLKIPTASEGKGLGTGALDHGYGIEISKLIGEKWLAFLDGGYNFIGNPDGVELQNQYWYDVGAGYYFTKNLLASVYFEEYRALVPGLVNIRDFFFAMNYKASAAWRFNGGVAVGVSNGAPDYVVSIGTSYRF
ncbi:MAG: transporter [Nitrospira sp.]|nr:transporter [Nitrospira sp.]MDR4463862.1 transporter [Nitrospira sp.]MDR4468107.1 transporter [Nitrospira sp.]